MSGRVINLFMWGYQDSYRVQIRSLARDVLRELGASAEAEVLLVGARSPDSGNRNPVCVEPEYGKWPLSLFDGLLDSVESTYRNHDIQNMFFGDEPSMRDKPERMRRDSVRTSVGLALKVFDAEHDVTSFCGEVRGIGDYYVTPVIQIPNTTFLQFPPLHSKPTPKGQFGNGFRSLIHAAMAAVLHEATEELQNPDPGRFTHRSMRSAEEVVQRSARYGAPGAHCWWAIPCNSSRLSPSRTPCSNTCARATKLIPIGSPIDNPRRRWPMKPPVGGAWRDQPMARPG
ncbi:conserved hypothetical protein [Xenorhabdus nematophila F1]|uniref:Probable sensor domain-containing protein n=1 Tax=Xenorhabdus nematophila (strain ATCC 19061 / DSM 3370 / CCUG 14189 / LMG 1036 / NCIMB 9965 / AN6) TaxID=406817 RepID=D3VE83_XENNA|nr:hypothetical protein XNC1_4312 [Xenorhabdus nematophila ATCC 19061]CCW31480.1 conserved hypothetical protein [Xenorhabdus nematophila F1]CEE92125.1 hypothetical protein XNA1_2670008 [Xenorhabdus nematophila str. Anatoliense]CEK25147.1 hypothetical protein XNC2_4160 [Xenorhabdus nematophila AN6/1]